MNKYPWKRVDCRRMDCLTCHSYLDMPETAPKQFKAGLNDCFTRGVCYMLTCVSYLKAGIKTIYIGETARSLHERIVEYVKGLKRRGREKWRKMGKMRQPNF